VNDWIAAAIAVGAGLVVGAITARLFRRALLRSSKPAVSASAAPVASVVFSAIFIVGLVVALGFVNPDSLETIPEDLFEFLPRLLAAVIVLIGGNVFATLATTASDKALRGTAAHRFGPTAVRWTILSFTAILAAAQLGVDTTIINIAAAALLFGLAAAMALLVGLGGRGVASEVAAGRAWRTTLAVGDRIAAADVGGSSIDGVVVEIHPTMIELDADGRSILVPNSQLLDVVVERTRDA
jgi:small-conductance mechanosensitive channel